MYELGGESKGKAISQLCGGCCMFVASWGSSSAASHSQSLASGGWTVVVAAEGAFWFLDCSHSSVRVS